MLALEGLGEVVDGEGHAHLRVATSINDPMILDCRDKHTDGVMERSLGFVEDVRARASQNDRACLISLTSAELNDLVLTNHDFLDGGASAEGGRLGSVES